MVNIFHNSGKSEQRGFTLIEIIVSLGVFAIVAVVAVAALLKIVSANKKAQSIQAAMTNLNFALESMSRELRVGAKYHCGMDYALYSDSAASFVPQSCSITSPSSDQAIIFRSSEQAVSSGTLCDSPSFNLLYAYKFDYDASTGFYKLQKARQKNGSCNPSAISDTDFADIVSPANVTITGYDLLVKYNSVSNQYPLASIRVQGYAGASERDKEYFDIQTAASARLP